MSRETDRNGNGASRQAGLNMLVAATEVLITSGASAARKDATGFSQSAGFATLSR